MLSETSFYCVSSTRRSNTKALQHKESIECDRITNDNQNIEKTNKKHVQNYRSSRTPEDAQSLRSSITLRAEQLNIRYRLSRTQTNEHIIGYCRRIATCESPNSHRLLSDNPTCIQTIHKTNKIKINFIEDRKFDKII